jgi:hypothetical protein
MTMRSRIVLPLAAIVVLVVTAVPVLAQDDGVGGGGGPAAQAANRVRPKPPAPTGPTPRRPDGKPDMTGNWDGSEGVLHNTVILEEHPGGFGVQAGKSLIIDPKDGVIPYQPWALAERNRRREDSNGYEDQVGHCEFYDIGRVHQFAKEFAFAGNNFVIHDTQHITRVIPLDRKEHLPSGVRLWLGDSIGRWEGDTLVVDTVGYNEKFWVDSRGTPHTEKMHTIERFSRPNWGTLHNQFTWEDPGALSKPVTLNFTGHLLRPDLKTGGGDLMEFICLEDNQYGKASGIKPGTGTTNEK